MEDERCLEISTHNIWPGVTPQSRRGRRARVLHPKIASLETFLLTTALGLTPTRAVFHGESDYSLRNTRSNNGAELLARDIRILLDGDSQVQDLTARGADLANILPRADHGAVEEPVLKGLHSRNRVNAAEARYSVRNSLAIETPSFTNVTSKERLKKLSKPAGNIKPLLAAQKHRSKEETMEAASKYRPRRLYLRDRKSGAEARLKAFKKPTGNLKPQLAAQQKKTKEETIKAASKKH
ncbi:unnamed protein product [Clonostachys rosea f. rosea IK726]|uniref:Uncharacterized protein n=1 Tax=Clonostachys rosea f. rosea IK726 TaxID=1349383 RepID=A0ACA9UG47_BIOOC|nr:unnamed protein product [Clonostachys rosea f. rosea IK726]